MKPFVYETMYILRPDLIDEQAEVAIAKYRELLEEQGAYNLEVQNLGKRRLAYEIQNHREGYYIQMNYQGPGSQIAVVERAMRLSDEVIRYLTTKQPISQPAETSPVEDPQPEEVQPTTESVS